MLNLLIWRKGETRTVTVKLEFLGAYSDTAPYNCEKNRKILCKGVMGLYENNQPDKAGLSLLCPRCSRTSHNSRPLDFQHTGDLDFQSVEGMEWATMALHAGSLTEHADEAFCGT